MIKKRRNIPEYHTVDQLYIMDRVTIDCNGCWNWNQALVTGDYGAAWHGGQIVRAHKRSYEAFNGLIPNGYLVLHHCDNTKCCNPEHIYAGTHQDNSNDKLERERQARGVMQGLSKLTERQVLDIYYDVRSLRTIAIDYPVTKTAVQHIKSGKTWGHITSHV